MLVEITTTMSNLFHALEQYENIKFEHEQEQFINSEIFIQDENSQWIPILAAIKKKDTGIKITTDTGNTIHCAKRHLMAVDGKTDVRFANSLNVGDTIVDSTKSSHVVKCISDSVDTDFYDIMVDSPTHLYQSSNKFVHHNTEISKQLAQVMGVEFIRFDMSEYQEKHSVSKFIGSPPGYVGYADGGSGSGVLINELERHPHSVILLDEIEKAHPDIVNIFLQIMDNGIISSQSGKSASARNTFIIFTSNLGAVSMEKSNIGFGNSERTDQGHEAVKNWFAPEFRNRLDAVIEFGRLSKDSMGKILDKFISQLNDLSSQKKVNIVFDSKAKDWLIDRGFDRNMGARPLTRVIQEHVKKPISREILFGSLKQGGGVMFTVHEDKLQYTIIETAPELTNLLTSTVEGTEECIPQ